MLWLLYSQNWSATWQIKEKFLPLLGIKPWLFRKMKSSFGLTKYHAIKTNPYLTMPMP
jgi:hypothetical protein